MLTPGDVVVVDFPGAIGTKRRPAAILSSDLYHASRPDVIFGLITSQTASAIAPTDHPLVDWAAVGLRVPSAFRSFVVTLPRTAIQHAIGRLSDRDWEIVRARLDTALAIRPRCSLRVDRVKDLEDAIGKPLGIGALASSP